MRSRDRAIIEDLQRFRCMTRDDIAEIHFKDVKSKVNSTNTVLKRLRRDGYVEVNTEKRPFLYFPAPSTMKRDSQKINHFLAIVDFYRQLLKYEPPRQFKVEPKFGKEYMEPDVFMIWKAAPFFVEIQKTTYSDRQMKEKMARYESYFYSDEWKLEAWQPRDKKYFPNVWIIGEAQYRFDKKPFRIIQTKNVEEFLGMLKA
jgi:hypothetical protein